MSTAADPRTRHDLAIRSFRLMEHWDDAEAEALIAPTYVNAEAVAEPPAARVPGVRGARATYDWLHSAYDNLRWTVHDVVAEDQWLVGRVTMSGRHVAPFVTYTPAGEVGQVFPATGRNFAVTQTHWFRIADGRCVEHLANRDDMGQALQLGWIPPSPLFLLRGAVLKRRLSRAA